MRIPPLHVSLLALGATALSGCFLASECTVPAHSLTVAVRDARTGAPIAGAEVAAAEGAYRETLSPVGQPAGTYAGTEQPGTYALTVTAPGYQPSARTVAVTFEDCQSRGWSVTIDLAPQ